MTQGHCAVPRISEDGRVIRCQTPNVSSTCGFTPFRNSRYWSLEPNPVSLYCIGPEMQAGVGVRLPGVRLLQDAGNERTPAGGAAAVLVPVLVSKQAINQSG